MTTEAAITIQRLSKSYQESGRQHEIFSELNLQVRRGEFIVLLGRSGSGKSTFLNLVSGIDPPDSGKVIINGINLTGLSEHDREALAVSHLNVRLCSGAKRKTFASIEYNQKVNNNPLRFLCKSFTVAALLR